MLIPSAFTRNVIDDDRSIESGYVAAARQLEREGAVAIITAGQRADPLASIATT